VNKPDPQAKFRQAIASLNSGMMLLMQLASDPEDKSFTTTQIRDALEDLTRARFLLVEVVEPDGILDELAKL
jgi:hypothetical protein